MSNIKTDKNKTLFRLNNTITVACLNENEFIKQFLQSKEGINSLNEKDKNGDYFLNRNIFDTSLITLKNDSIINSTNQTFREVKIIMDEIL